ncbi:MAG: insulinase family protein [Venatoribacter sp.]
MFSVRYWIFFLVLFAAIGFSMFRMSQPTAVIKSPNDNAEYRQLTLANGLRVLLVSTPDTQKAAAAVSVDVGSGDDPKGREGLAHFLEHMLFLGTKPYPDPEEYQAYISRHGGSHNAFTAHQQTTYFFDIDNSAFEEALERFAPFFISPTFDATYVEREKNAVNSEYRAKYKDDFRRIYSAEKQVMNPEHGFSHFSVGSLDTLADRDNSKIRDELIQFYQNHYSADKMSLVLAGNYPLAQLESWAKHYFAAVEKRPTEARTVVPLFVPGQLPMDMNIEPIKEIRTLQFSFPLPESRSHYQNKPVSLISSLLGHEGEGSLLAFLKAKGWAEGLSAGRSLSTESENLLVVQIQLTTLGLLHIDHITQALLYYIDLMKSQPLPQYLFTEQQQLAEIMFRFQEQSRLTDRVIRLSSNLLQYPATDVIYGDYRWDTPNTDVVTPYLAQLNGNNMLRTLVAPKVTTEFLDPWYQTPIRIRPLQYQPDDEFAASLTELHLPAANPFIPTDFELHNEGPQATPSLLVDTPNDQLWYYPENQFKVPKSRVLIKLEKQGQANSAKQRMLAHLYARAINDALNTYSYPASLAGLSYHLKANSQGLEITLSGYQHKLSALLERIVQQIKTTDIAEAKFDQYRESLQLMLENQLKNKPYERALGELQQWLYDPSFSEVELLEALKQISRQDLTDYAQAFSQHLALTMFVQGTLGQAQAKALHDTVLTHLAVQAPLSQEASIVQVPIGEHQLNLNLNHDDSAFLLYVQGQDNSDYSRARFALLGQILSSPYYQQLRTEEQLGYIVFATQYPQLTVPGLVFLVQSPTATPTEIYQSSQRFFDAYQERLAKLSEQEFNSFKQGLQTQLLEKPKNLGEKFAQFWREISIGRLGFDTNQAIANEIEKLTLTDIQDLYAETLLGASPKLFVTQGGALKEIEPLAQVQRSLQPHFEIKQP